MKQVLIVCGLLTAYILPNIAQAQNDKQTLNYIERYRSLAMSEQQRTGMPAAIKLAQGILETGAGTSELATQANNHFGLKCKSNWTGAIYEYTDDRRNECFRKYTLDFESYQDQSDYLKSSSRYASLFSLSVTDYAAWAFGLNKAGYATNPEYAKRLIKLIEDYRLQEYTYLAMGNSTATNTAPKKPAVPATPPTPKVAKTYGTPSTTVATQPQVTTPTTQPSTTTGTSWLERRRNARQATTPAVSTTTTQIDNTPPERSSKFIQTKPRKRQTLVRTQENGQTVEHTIDNDPNKVEKINNLKAVEGKRGDMPLQYAVRNNIRYEKFLEINDLEEAPLPADMPLYLERKHFWGLRPMHLVKPGETMLIIAQKEGIQLKYLRDLNYIEENEEPVPGITLELQSQAIEKPKVVSREVAVSNGVGDAAYYAIPPQKKEFPKNPAPIYEEKNFFDKIKEKIEKEKQEKDKKNGMTVYEETVPQTNYQPAAQQESKYIQRSTPVQSYSRTQYSYRTTGDAEQTKAEAEKRAAEQARIVAERQAQAHTAEQARVTAEREAQARAAEQARITAEREAQARAAEQARIAAEREAQVRAAAQARAAEQARVTAEREAQARAAEQARIAAEREAQVRAAAQARAAEQARMAEQQRTQPVQSSYSRSEYSYSTRGNTNNSQQSTNDLDKLKAKFDNVIYSDRNKANNAEQARIAAEQAAQARAAEQARIAAEGEAQARAAEQARIAAEGEAQARAAEQARIAAEGEAQARAAEQARITAEQAAQARAAQAQNAQPQGDPSKYYMVKKGDTAYTIAKKHGVTIRKLMDMNGLDFDEIKEGQYLRVKE